MDIVTDIDKLYEIGRCKEIDLEIYIKEARNISKELKKAIKNHNISALSAPALLFNHRIFCIDYVDYETKTYINPIVIKRNGITISREVCSSIPNKEYLIPRNTEIEIMFQDINGATKKQTFNGISACVVQHELDHIDGLTLKDIGLEIDKDFDTASDSDKQKIVDMYIKSLKEQKENINEDIKNDDIAHAMHENIRFEEALIDGKIKLEKLN